MGGPDNPSKQSLKTGNGGLRTEDWQNLETTSLEEAYKYNVG